MKTRLCALMLCFSMVVPARSDDAVLTIPGEAKAAAMGEAYSASAAGAEGLWYNPATLSLAPCPTLSLLHAAYLESVTFNTLAVATPLKERFAAGVGLSYLNVGSIPSFDNTGAAASAYSPNDLCFRLGASTKLNQTSLGLAAYYLKSTIAETASTIGFNFGLHQFIGPAALALVMENFGGKLKYQSEEAKLPQRMKVGASVRVLPRFLINVESVKPKSGSTSLGTGFEYDLNSEDFFGVVFRGGYNTRSTDATGANGLSAGIGFGLRGTKINYAWVPFGDLGQTHRVSLDIKFAPDDAIARAEKEMNERVLLRPSPKIDMNDPRAEAAGLPKLPWKRFRRGWRTSKERIMDLLARDAVCTVMSAEAVMTRVRGTVEIRTEGNAKRLRHIRAGQYVFDGDTVRTYAAAYAHIVFANGVKAEVGPNTVFAVQATEQKCEMASVRLESGRIFAVAETGKSLDVQTPGGDKHIEGSEGLVIYDGKTLSVESPREPITITEPDTRRTPGRWDAPFSRTFEAEIMRLDSTPGLALAEYVRDTSLRNELKLKVFDMKNRRNEIRSQASNFKEDLDGFAALKAELKKVPENEARKARKERLAAFKQTSKALRNAESTLGGLEKELKTLVRSVRENEEYLAAIPIVRMLNITAQESTIPFEKSRAMVPDSAHAVLDSIAESISRMKPYRVVVEGHTDTSGTARSNERLSKQRAEAVAQYLHLKTGRPSRTFLTKGMGAKQPIVTSDNLDEMAKNRRVEIWFEMRGL